jgi:hypothetical protein
MKLRFFLLTIFMVTLATVLASPARAIETVRPGDTVDGSLERRDPQLEDGCYYDEYVIEADTGTLLTITQTSEEIDCYLVILCPDGRQLDNDDYHPGESTDARLTVLINDRGDYEILATSYSEGESGDYMLLVEEVPQPNYYGIFIGVERYGREWEDAPLCDDDAIALYDSFVHEGLMSEENGIVLTNRDANTQNVENAFDEIAQRITGDDVFVFFFSGHGEQVPTEREDGKEDELDSMDEAICLRDNDLIDNDLASLLDTIPARLSLIVLDACNSGGVATDIVRAPGRVCFASSEEDVLSDFAPELEAGGYLSVFFREAIEGAADLDGDGMIMMGELTRYLLQRYYQEVPDPDSAIYGYQELVHLRGLVPQDEIFCWFNRGNRGRDNEKPERPE